MTTHIKGMKAIKAWLRELAKQGGRMMTPAQTAARRANAKKARETRKKRLAAAQKQGEGES